MVQKPILQALVLADHVYADAITGKKIIAGVFHNLWAATFPTKFGRLTWAYVCLTEVQGSVPITLRYTDLRTNEVLLSTRPLTMQSSDPLQSCELLIQVPPFPMPHTGTYVFEVFAGDESIGSLRITVGEVKKGKT